MAPYRWDRRRAKKQANSFANRHGFDILDLVLLILIFTIGLVIARLFMIYAITTSSGCPDLPANLGATPYTPPAFKLFVYISILMFIFWVCRLTLYKSRKQKSWAHTIWQTLILISILQFGLTNYHMSIWNNPRPPDGTLAVANGVWGTENEERVWKNLPLLPSFDKDSYGHTVYMSQYRQQKCVWLASGRISVNDDPFIGNHADYAEKRLQEWKDTGYMPNRYPAPFYNPPKTNWHALFARQSWMETFRNQREYTRPLTPAERQRFLTKQKCLKAIIRDPHSGNTKQKANRREQCDPLQFPPPPAEW